MQISEEQQTILKQSMDAIRAAFPGDPVRDKKYAKNMERLIASEIAPALAGKPPTWSEKSGGYNLGKGAIFNAGAFCVYWGKDPDSGEPVALLHIRKETDTAGQYKHGAIGGYTEKPEQSFIGILREGLEEVCDPKGTPIIAPEAANHVVVLEGKDYDSKDPPVQYVGFACELTPEQMKALKTHMEKCKDSEYMAAVTAATNGETMGAKLLPVADIAAMSPAEFTYSRQYDLYQEVAARLGAGRKKTMPSSPIGYTIGDSPELYVSRITGEKNNRQTFKAF